MSGYTKVFSRAARSAVLSDDQLRQLIANGVAKINYYTALSDSAAKQIDENAKTGSGSGYTGLVKNIRSVVATETERCMHLWGAAGRAGDGLSSCRPWLPVAHLIIYNVHGVGKADAEAMIAEGRRVLSAIPSVREVFAGEAVQHDAKYRYGWLVRFCHAAVINSYREHPDHMAFANNLFRPVAGERISIDYQTVVPEPSHADQKPRCKQRGMNSGPLLRGEPQTIRPGLN